MTTWTPILITTDGDVLLYKAVGDYFCLLKHSVSGTQRHSYPREEARALYLALGRWLGAEEMICEAEHCHARPVSDFDAVAAPRPPWLEALRPDSVERAAGILELQGDDPATLVRRLRATVQLLATAPEAELGALAQECAAMDGRIYAATREQGQRMPLAAPAVDSESRGSTLASPQGSTGFLEGKNEVSAESVLEHCLTVEALWYRHVCNALEEEDLKAKLLVWRLPASGRYADHAAELARASGGRYPVGEAVGHE